MEAPHLEKQIESDKPIANQFTTCRLIQPNETLKFGEKELTNVGTTPTIACGMLEGFSEDQVLDSVQQQPYYKEYDAYRTEIIEQCQNEGKIPAKRCQSQPYIRSHLLIGTTSDPFDTTKATHIKTRYIANLVRQLYKPEKDVKGQYKHQFHGRNFHYRMLSENLAMPVYDKDKGWHLTRYTGSNKDYQNLNEALTEGRNAGLIPFDQIIDRRVMFNINPAVYPINRARNDKYLPNVSLDMSLNKDFNLDIDVPQVIFYSEKSEMGPVLKILSEKYPNVGYFLGRGHISTSNAYRLYEFIKERGDNAIVMTLCDYDASGLNIAQSLSRKLQFHRQIDTAEIKPDITVHQFAISPKDAQDLEQKGLEMGIKLYKDGDEKKAKKIYELAALEVFARDKGISLSEYIEQELLKVLKHDPGCIECSTLISKEQINTRMAEEKTRLEREIQTSLNDTLNKLSNKDVILHELNIIPNADGSINIMKYSNQLLDFYRALPSFTALETATQCVVFEPKDIVQNKVEYVDDQGADSEALLWASENPSYQRATQRLNQFKQDTRDIIEFADPDVQKAKEVQRRLDVMKTDKESNEELAERILNILDENDKVESYHALVAILNNDPDTLSNYYVGSAGQFYSVMQDLKHQGKITYLPVTIGKRGIGWYRGEIHIPNYEPKIARPEFETREERNIWELKQYGTKSKVKKELIKEAKQMFQSFNHDTQKFWTLTEIGQALGGYGATAIYNWLKKAGVNTKSLRIGKK
jgi:5S rRNA maturation endonuclease (ribonuclease M5)